MSGRVLRARVWAPSQTSTNWLCLPTISMSPIRLLTAFKAHFGRRVPQVLANFGAIHYSDRLLALLKEPNHLLRSGDDYEVEIRAASIVTVERIKDILKTANDNSINSVIIDFYLWDYRRENSEAIERKTPFHRVRSIYYWLQSMTNFWSKQLFIWIQFSFKYK